MSSLPEWKQMLLERKRREEEEREKREREEKERLANMPAWKRGIIQRRRAKQEGEREKDRERDKDSGFQVLDYKTGTENITDKEFPAVLVIDFGTDSKPQSQVSLETIGPVRHNPFVRYQDAKRKDREGGKGGEWEKGTGKVQDNRMETEKGGETQRKSSSHYTEWGKDRGAEMILKEDTTESTGKGKECEEEAEENRKQWLRYLNESQGRKVDLKDTLASGWSVSEISASGVLLIKPTPNLSVGTEGSNEDNKDIEVEGEAERDEKKEPRRQTAAKRESDGRSGIFWCQKERETVTWGEISRESMRERSRARTKMGVISGMNISSRHEKETQRDKHNEREGEGLNLDSWDLAEGHGRVSELLSKFGECRKRPSRSKSTDCCDRTKQEHWNSRPRLSLGETESMERGRRRSEDNHKEGGRGPKRSVSFSNSERLVIDKEHLHRREMQSGLSEIVGVKEASSKRVYLKSSPPKAEADIQCGSLDGIQVMQSMQSESRALINTGKQREIEREIGRETQEIIQRPLDKTCDKEREKAEQGRVPIVNFSREGTLVLEVPSRQVPVEKSAKQENDEKEQEEMQNITTVISEKLERNKSVLNEEQEHPIQCDKIIYRNKFKESLNFGETKCDKQNEKGRPKEGETNIWKHTFLDDIKEKKSDKNCFVDTHEKGKEGDKAGSHQEGHTETCTDGYIEIKSDMKMGGPKIIITEAPSCRVEFGEKSGEMKLDRPSEKGLAQGEEWTGIVRRESWKAGRPLTRIESLREKIRQKEMEKQMEKMKEGGNMSEKRSGEEEEGETNEEEVRIKEISMLDGKEKRLTERDGQRATAKEEELRCGMQKVILSLASCPPETAFQTGSAKLHLQSPGALTFPEYHSNTKGEEKKIITALCSHHTGPTDGGRAQEQVLHVEGFDRGHQTGQGAGDGIGESNEEMLEELYDLPYRPPSLSPSPPISYSPSTPRRSDVTVSPVCSPKSAFSRLSINTSEIRNNLLHNMKTEQATHPYSSNTIPEKPLSSWKSNQDLELKLKKQQLRSEDTPEELEAFQEVQQKHGQLRYSETKSQWIQNHEQLQEEDQELYGQRPQPEKEQTSINYQKAPCLLHQHNQNTPPKRNQFKQPKSNFPTAVSPKSTQYPKNSVKNTKEGHNSLSPSASPDPFPSQSSPAVQIRRGNTITITPRKGGVGESSVTSTGVSHPQAQPADTHNMVYKSRRRYPVVEEIEVIGGYQTLEKSCLSRNRRTNKEVNVCFDEVQLEQVCEYPSEISMLASLPSSPMPGSERRKEEEVEEEEEEEEQDQRGASVFRSARSMLRVDESCRY